jgi:hypothetical protein
MGVEALAGQDRQEMFAHRPVELYVFINDVCVAFVWVTLKEATHLSFTVRSSSA